MHICPLLWNFPQTIRLAAEPIAAVSSTMVGDFPPNSKVTEARFLAAAFITILPIEGAPVKKIWLNGNSKSAVEVSNIKAQTQTTAAVSDNSQYDGVYSFSSLSMVYRGSQRDMPIGGTYTLKDGFVTITTKDASVKYKIKNIENGLIYCEDRNMTHLLRIEPETGKKKGKDYDTKINIIMDQELGGSITDYWCKKM